MYRAVKMSIEDLQQLETMARLTWSQKLIRGFVAMPAEERGPVGCAIVAVEVTDGCSKLLDPFVLWKYELQVTGRTSLRALMAESVHAQLLAATQIDFLELTNVSDEDTKKVISEIQQQQPRLQKLLEGAAYVDPVAAADDQAPPTTTPNLMN